MLNRLSLHIALCAAIAGAATSCSDNTTDRLHAELTAYAGRHPGHIGVAIITADGDTTGININDNFPAMSTYKLPIALVFAEKMKQAGSTPDDTINIEADQLDRDTYSPMLADFRDSTHITYTYRALLEYSLAMSDNNASDILLAAAGGPEAVAASLRRDGHYGINVCNSEKEMHADTALARVNSTTPLAMARLISDLANNCRDQWTDTIFAIIGRTSTGLDRLPAPFAGDSRVTVHHKTGTGFDAPDGSVTALADAGFISVADDADKSYTIAVYIANSGCSIDSAAAMIGEISRIAAEHLHGNR